MLYYSQIVNNGGLKSEGGEYEPMITLRLTSMSRPQELQVGGEHFRREAVSYTHLPLPTQAKV